MQRRNHGPLGCSRFESQPPKPAMEFLVLLIAFGAAYAILILPQQRRVRQHDELVAALEVGDEVITHSGIYGTIVAFEGEQAEVMRLEVAEGVTISMARSAVTEVAVEEPDEPGDES
jgi:preprotein translocase subunit YajC